MPAFQFPINKKAKNVTEVYTIKCGKYTTFSANIWATVYRLH